MAAKALGGSNGAAIQENSSDEALSCIVELTKSQGLEFRTAEALKRSTSYRSFCDKCVALQDYLSKACERKAMRYAILKIGLGLLIEDCRRMDLAVSAVLLMRHIHRVPSLIDQAYPGYYVTGLLKYVVGKHVNGHSTTAN